MVDSGQYKWILDFNSAIKAGMKKVALKRMEVFGSMGKSVILHTETFHTRLSPLKHV